MARVFPHNKRDVVFDRGQRADTLRPGQGVGLSVAREIVDQYDGNIDAGESLLGGQNGGHFWSSAAHIER
jgi:two-component system sensor histidine kinase PhoQ